MSEGLKPCPFCGGEAETATPETIAVVSCTKCAACVVSDNPTDAIAAWNARANTDEFDVVATPENMAAYGWFKAGETCCNGCVDEDKREFTNCSWCVRAGWLDYYEPKEVDDFTERSIESLVVDE